MSLGLTAPLLSAVAALGYDQPTPIQALAIPEIIAGHDVAAEAPTGSGKTAAFALPLLIKLLAGSPGWSPRVLVLAPTRELALQIAASFKGLTRFTPLSLRVVGLIGGQPVEDQVAALDLGADVAVATPGRLLDLLERQALDLADLQTLVLDEADKLLELGFADALDAMLATVPTPRQTLLFSATLPGKVLALAARAQNEPVLLRVNPVATPVETIAQRVIEVPSASRRMVLQHMIEADSWGQTLVFVATQRAAHNLAVKLQKAGIASDALHGGLDQPERLSVLDRFKRTRFAVLVATDLAARGIDIPNLDVVVNYDLPRSPNDYLHRIGRTGRAGASGRAVSFIDHDSAAHFVLIEKRSGIRLEREQVAGFELTGEAPGRVPGPEPVKGKRKSKKDKLREAAARQAQMADVAAALEVPEIPEVPDETEETEEVEQTGVDRD